jgi:cyanate permease
MAYNVKPMDGNLNARGDRYRWVVLAIAVASTAIGVMIFASAFPLLNLWVRDLGISHAKAGVLTGLWYVTGIFVALPIGWLADRVPLRRLLLGLWVLNIAGTLLMATASGFLMLCAGRVIFSVGTTGHLVAAPKLVATWFHDRRESGLVMGVYSMSMTAGVYASLIVLGRIGERYGWHAAVLLLVGVAACGFLMMFLVPPEPVPTGDTGAGTRFSPLHLGLAAWVLALAYGGYSVATEAYLTFSPDYLVQRGLGVAAASTMLGVYAWVALGLKPIFASHLQSANGAYYIVTASAIFVTSVVVLLTLTVPPVVSAVAFGVSLALAMPAFAALPALLFGSGKSGQVYGLCGLFYGLGAITQPLVGWTVDRTGQYTAGYAVICAFAGLSLIGGIWLAREGAPRSASSVSQPKVNT